MFTISTYAQSTLVYEKTLSTNTSSTAHNIELIKELQGALMYVGLDIGASKPDGDFGPKTASAVRAIQRYHSIGVDSKAGPITYNHLNETIKILSDYDNTNNYYAAYYTRQAIADLQY
jgi:peptidoglycan hydrolase-like protein with peptidoglycan-binding domain